MKTLLDYLTIAFIAMALTAPCWFPLLLIPIATEESETYD